jgi:hypothetical protein
VPWMGLIGHWASKMRGCCKASNVCAKYAAHAGPFMPAHRCKCLNESAGASPWVTAARCNGDLECFAQQTDEIKTMITRLMYCLFNARRGMAAATSLGTISKESKVSCRPYARCHDRGTMSPAILCEMEPRVPQPPGGVCKGYSTAVQVLS